MNQVADLDVVSVTGRKCVIEGLRCIDPFTRIEDVDVAFANDLDLILANNDCGQLVNSDTQQQQRLEGFVLQLAWFRGKQLEQVLLPVTCCDVDIKSCVCV
jgi:hypothetical protein